MQGPKNEVRSGPMEHGSWFDGPTGQEHGSFVASVAFRNGASAYAGLSEVLLDTGATANPSHFLHGLEATTVF